MTIIIKTRAASSCRGEFFLFFCSHSQNCFALYYSQNVADSEEPPRTPGMIDDDDVDFLVNDY